MKPGMDSAQLTVSRWLEGRKRTVGLYVRVHGDHLILGRREPWGPEGGGHR